MEGWGEPQLQRRYGHRYGNGNGNVNVNGGGGGGGGDNPSFSSTLLDAIYRSIDESDGRGEKHRGGGGGTGTHRPVPVAAQKRSGGCVSGAAATRLRPGHSTSSSSECSSYGGFSSSEAESGPGSARLRPIRTGLQPEPAPAPPIQSPRRSAKPPASPGARIASFVASLFAAAARSPRRPKAAAAAAAAPPPQQPPQPRSCLSRTPSTRDRPRPRAPPPAPRGEEGAGKRSVRFHAASAAAGEDRRACGHRRVHDGDRAAAEARRRVEELLRGFEEEEDLRGSDASSDLFELETLTAIGGGVGGVGGGGGGGFGDELPVYETTTTRRGANRAIARHGLIL